MLKCGSIDHFVKPHIGHQLKKYLAISEEQTTYKYAPRAAVGESLPADCAKCYQTVDHGSIGGHETPAVTK